MHYVLDHYYAVDHRKYCRIVKTDMEDPRQVADLLTAIQFCFEDLVDESGNPELDAVVELLENHFGFEAVDKASCEFQLFTVMDYMSDLDYEPYEDFYFADGKWIYLDLYAIREERCGPGQYEALSEVWLTDEIREDIKDLAVEQ